MLIIAYAPCSVVWIVYKLVVPKSASWSSWCSIPTYNSITVAGSYICFMYIPQTLQNMRIERSPKLIWLQKSHLGIHWMKNTQTKKHIWQIFKGRSLSLPWQQGNKGLLVKSSCTRCLMRMLTFLNDDNFVTALSGQIQVSVALIGTVKKPPIEPTVLTKWWGITLQKTQKSIQVTMKEELGLCSILLCLGNSEQMIVIFAVAPWHIQYSLTQWLQVQC